MQTINRISPQEEWVKILAKGMVTIPKSFRDDLGIREGEIAKIKKIGSRLIIEPRETADYEVYSDNELKEMLQKDKLPQNLAQKAAGFWPDLK
ncbi:AbrB/MazE/SpoVT family DNA-binding domain-containing protein [Candidatus Microgenomates bacterium]|nr:AbrB/MazE/SpoVT family DNA-binding domain-containing protein [Candidatus Microgenomates bacterium]